MVGTEVAMIDIEATDIVVMDTVVAHMATAVQEPVSVIVGEE